MIQGRYSDCQQGFYDTNWILQDFYSLHYPKIEVSQKKPVQLKKMLELSKTLADGFAFVRVDWYLVGDDIIYFGEMTFTPDMGVQHWNPPKMDIVLGSMITLPDDKYFFN